MEGGAGGFRGLLVRVVLAYDGKRLVGHWPHPTLNQAAPLRALPDGVTDLDHFRVLRRHRAGGVIHEYRLVA